MTKDEVLKPEQELFVVKHYSSDERPTIKGNGFDGLEVGTDREDAEEFIAWVNARISTPPQRKPDQEPVAWRSWNDKDKFGFWDTKAEAESWCDLDFDSEPLYTTPPPQRTWVGLTEEDKTEYERKIVAAEREACAKTVEQAGIDGFGTLAAAAAIRERKNDAVDS